MKTRRWVATATEGLEEAIIHILAISVQMFFAVVVLLRMRGTILERERRARWLLAAEAQA